MAIRKANYNDAGSVYELICNLESFEFDREKFETRFKMNLINDAMHYYVFEEGENILGFGSLIILSPLHHAGKIGEIQELVVKKDVRGRSIGKKILEHIEGIVTNMELETIEIASNLKRADAHRFYEREGYQKTHTKLTKQFKWKF
jgi:PhnO protein